MEKDRLDVQGHTQPPHQGRESNRRGTPYLAVRNVSKYFGAFRALNDISLDVAEGELVCFLGPSGCGKTTLLRCIAGLESLSAGSIVQGGVDVTRLPPSGRDFGIVFQSYALFPNLTVAQNIRFGIERSDLSRAEIAARVDELLQLVGLHSQERKYPSQISGGQQQRVALARALAPSPGLLLLDEPLSALDAQVRAHLRREIVALQRRVGITTIMVTHDQEEALTMADRIVVLRDGRLEQVGTPLEIYSEPASPFVASFIGVMNFIPAEVAGENEVRAGTTMLAVPTAGRSRGARVLCAIRPEDVLLSSDTSAANTIDARIAGLEYLGSYVRLYLASALSGDLRLDIRADRADALKAGPGARIALTLPAERIRLYTPEAA